MALLARWLSFGSRVTSCGDQCSFDGTDTQLDLLNYKATMMVFVGSFALAFGVGATLTGLVFMMIDEG